MDIVEEKVAPFEDISDRLLAFGNKFLKEAEAAANVNSASKSFGLAERALNLALKFNSKLSLLETTNSQGFLMNFDRPISRPELWAAYLEFCAQSRFIPIPKGKFFQRLELYDFDFRKSGGVWTAYPPRNLSRLKQIPDSEIIEGLEL